MPRGRGNVSTDYKIAIIGSGPGGLSAAGHAAELNVPHVLIEKAAHLSDTLFKFQKGKFVMSTPDVLPLRSPMPFAAGKREDILGNWDDTAASLNVNVRLSTEVVGVEGEKGNFTIKLGDGSTITAEAVILGIGLQGNLNKLRVPGADLPHIQYQLDDPDEYELERIIVIGAGDAAIENAVALSVRNTVYVLNRGEDFARAKPANEALINSAIDAGRIQPIYKANTLSAGEGTLTVETPDGELTIECDRVIARMGASPPRKFVESCGVVFPSDARNALPECTEQYESNVPGLYIVGALGGYPLIKQAINQGYEAVEYILGNAVEPADSPILKSQISILNTDDVEGFLRRVRESIPIFANINSLMLREMMVESTVHKCAAGDVVFEKNDYTNSFYVVLEGAVAVVLDQGDHEKRITIGLGNYFGEMGLISGRRRTATIKAESNCVLIEIPRRTMIKVRGNSPDVRQALDQEAAIRQIQTYIAPDVPREDLIGIAESSQIKSFKLGEVLFNEGDEADSLHLIRKGSVSVSKRLGGRSVVLNYVATGNYVGEMGLVSNAPRSATVTAAVACETIQIDGSAFKNLMASNLKLKASVESKFKDRITQNERASQAGTGGGILQFLLEQGVSEGTDVLLIDEALCIGCDNCETACAETHEGISRLDREAGPTYQTMHIPTSCRHCENPHCMTDCPPDAIKRSPSGEVFIEDSCIGCGNCARSCPYGVIQLASPENKKAGVLSRLFAKSDTSEKAPKKAVKCDMCRDIEGGPSCVRACPTGAAVRVAPQALMQLQGKAS
jgi:CRP-like cAMP-binding protein/thioredoxin reductase/Fe-S-cluster-containing hydrogenase component 2